jgi:hypothetical protein
MDVTIEFRSVSASRATEPSNEAARARRDLQFEQQWDVDWEKLKKGMSLAARVCEVFEQWLRVNVVSGP